MNIADACQTIRAWNDLFSGVATQRRVPGHLHDAAAELKRYLEEARGDGQPIAELQIAEHLLATRSGLQWVMPFVLNAEATERSGRSKRLGCVDSPDDLSNPTSRAVSAAGLGSIERMSAGPVACAEQLEPDRDETHWWIAYAKHSAVDGTARRTEGANGGTPVGASRPAAVPEYATGIPDF
jgi:hypothetical protein